MSVVSLLGVNVMNNPAKFTDKYEFEITFECLEQLEKGRSSPHPILLAPRILKSEFSQLTLRYPRSRVEAHLRRLGAVRQLRSRA